MKAELTRELSQYNCSMCGRAQEIMDKGICAPKCVQEFKLDKEIKNELTKLEASAQIGQAYQWAYENGIVSIDPESLVMKFKESEGE